MWDQRSGEALYISLQKGKVINTGEPLSGLDCSDGESSWHESEGLSETFWIEYESCCPCTVNFSTFNKITKSRSHEIGCYNNCIATKFDRHLGSAWKSLNMNLVASRLRDLVVKVRPWIDRCQTRTKRKSCAYILVWTYECHMTSCEPDKDHSLWHLHHAEVRLLLSWQVRWKIWWIVMLLVH